MLNLDEEGIKEILASLETFRSQVAQEDRLKVKPKTASLNEDRPAVKRRSSLTGKNFKRHSLCSRPNKISRVEQLDENKLYLSGYQNTKCSSPISISRDMELTEDCETLTTVYMNDQHARSDPNLNGPIETARKLSGSSQEALLDYAPRPPVISVSSSNNSLTVPTATPTRVPSAGRWQKAALAVAVNAQNAKSAVSEYSKNGCRIAKFLGKLQLKKDSF